MISDTALTVKAERVVFAYEQMESLLGGFVGGHEDPMSVSVEVCRRWIAEHPADGIEPQTPEWLRSVGFAADGNPDLPDPPLAYTLLYGREEIGIAEGTDTGRHILIDKAGDVLIEEYKPNGDVIACIELPPVKTREDVRRLMLGFGVTLATPKAPVG